MQIKGEEDTEGWKPTTETKIETESATTVGDLHYNLSR